MFYFYFCAKPHKKSSAAVTFLLMATAHYRKDLLMFAQRDYITICLADSKLRGFAKLK